MQSESNIHILTNTLPHPTDRAAVEAAVKHAIAGRPGEWRVLLMEPHNASYWQLTITGPMGFTWNRRFDGPTEQSPEYIENTVRSALQDQRIPTFDAVARVLDAKWVEGKSCPVCGNTQWSIGELPHMLQPLGGGSTVMPVYPVTCTNCGLTFLFNAIRAGILPEGAA